MPGHRSAELMTSLIGRSRNASSRQEKSDFVRSEYPLERLYDFRQRALEQAECQLADRLLECEFASATVAHQRDNLQACHNRMTAFDQVELEWAQRGAARVRDLQQVFAWRLGVLNEINKLTSELKHAESVLGKCQHSLLVAEQQAATARQQLAVIERHRQNFQAISQRTEEAIGDEDATEIWQAHHLKPPFAESK